MSGLSVTVCTEEAVVEEALTASDELPVSAAADVEVDVAAVFVEAALVDEAADDEVELLPHPAMPMANTVVRIAATTFFAFLAFIFASLLHVCFQSCYHVVLKNTSFGNIHKREKCFC